MEGKEPIILHWLCHIDWKPGDAKSKDMNYNIIHLLILKSSGFSTPWLRHEMETFSTLLAICAVNSPVPGEFPA